MICSDPKLDSHRFKDIIDEAIDAGVGSFLYATLIFQIKHSSNIFLTIEACFIPVEVRYCLQRFYELILLLLEVGS